jgi:hypothetical protein
MSKNVNEVEINLEKEYVDFDDVLAYSDNAVKTEEKINAETYNEDEDDFKLWKDLDDSETEELDEEDLDEMYGSKPEYYGDDFLTPSYDFEYGISEEVSTETIHYINSKFIRYWSGLDIRIYHSYDNTKFIETYQEFKKGKDLEIRYFRVEDKAIVRWKDKLYETKMVKWVRADSCFDHSCYYFYEFGLMFKTFLEEYAPEYLEEWNSLFYKSKN